MNKPIEYKPLFDKDYKVLNMTEVKKREKIDPKVLEKYLKDNRFKIDKKYIPALANMLENDDDISMGDIEDMDTRGYGVTVEFGRNGPEYWFMTDKEADYAVEEDIDNIIDDMGVTSFTDWFWKNHIDWDKVKNDLESDEKNNFEEMFREQPESYSDYIDWDLVEKRFEDGIFKQKNIDKSFMQWLEYEGEGFLPEKYRDTQTGKIDEKKWKDDVKKHIEFRVSMEDLDLLEYLYDANDFIVQETAAEEWWKEFDVEDFLEDIYGKDSKEYSDFIKGYVDIDALKKDAVKTDGRGHFLNHYDGEEQEHKGIYYYRTN